MSSSLRAGTLEDAAKTGSAELLIKALREYDFTKPTAFIEVNDAFEIIFEAKNTALIEVLLASAPIVAMLADRRVIRDRCGFEAPEPLLSSVLVFAIQTESNVILSRLLQFVRQQRYNLSAYPGIGEAVKSCARYNATFLRVLIEEFHLDPNVFIKDQFEDTPLARSISEQNNDAFTYLLPLANMRSLNDAIYWCLRDWYGEWLNEHHDQELGLILARGANDFRFAFGHITNQRHQDVLDAIKDYDVQRDIIASHALVVMLDISAWDERHLSHADRLAALRTLLRLGADIDFLWNTERQPLVLAARALHFDILRELLTRGAVLPYDPVLRGVVLDAVDLMNDDLVTALVAEQRDVNFALNTPRNPLMLAVTSNNPSAALQLLSRGAALPTEPALMTQLTEFVQRHLRTELPRLLVLRTDELERGDLRARWTRTIHDFKRIFPTTLVLKIFELVSGSMYMAVKELQRHELDWQNMLEGLREDVLGVPRNSKTKRLRVEQASADAPATVVQPALGQATATQTFIPEEIQLTPRVQAGQTDAAPAPMEIDTTPGWGLSLGLGFTPISRTTTNPTVGASTRSPSTAGARS